MLPPLKERNVQKYSIDLEASNPGKSQSFLVFGNKLVNTASLAFIFSSLTLPDQQIGEIGLFNPEVVGSTESVALKINYNQQFASSSQNARYAIVTDYLTY